MGQTHSTPETTSGVVSRGLSAMFKSVGAGSSIKHMRTLSVIVCSSHGQRKAPMFIALRSSYTYTRVHVPIKIVSAQILAKAVKIKIDRMQTANWHRGTVCGTGS